MSIKIPFVDLKAQYENINAEIDDAINNVIVDTAFIKGKYVERFENAFAESYGVSECIGCANGTDAIYIALKSIGIDSGDEVITVSNSWISTSETITQAGAKPVFVDIDPDYFTININEIEKKITNKTKAIIPVHLFGQPVDMDSIMKIANKYDIKVIEDCAQAHFAQWKGKNVGTFGIAGTFSFFPGKNLGAYGDAGGIISNDKNFLKQARMFANHGSLVKHQHQIEGINSRLDGIQASILSVKLKYIKGWNDQRRINAMHYNKFLRNLKQVILPKVNPNVSHVFHLYVILAQDRDLLKNFLEKNGVAVSIHYPTPLPYLNAYKYLNHHPEDFPVSFHYKDRILSLPMYPELSSLKIKKICNLISEFYS